MWTRPAKSNTFSSSHQPLFSKPYSTSIVCDAVYTRLVYRYCVCTLLACCRERCKCRSVPTRLWASMRRTMCWRIPATTKRVTLWLWWVIWNPTIWLILSCCKWWIKKGMDVGVLVELTSSSSTPSWMAPSLFHVLQVGSHLDSVPAGPGINDNGWVIL